MCVCMKKIGSVIARSAMTDFSGGFSDIVVVLLSCAVDTQRVQDTGEILI